MTQTPATTISKRRIRRIIREETGLTPVAPAEKWRGGQLVLRPGKPGVQEKAMPIDSFFNKVVMLRNRLRTLEQQVNASELPDDQKLKIQGYITGCYGSLTSFNVLFADDDDRFVGTAASADLTLRWLFAQLSFSDTVRLNTGAPARESGSTAEVALPLELIVRAAGGGRRATARPCSPSALRAMPG